MENDSVGVGTVNPKANLHVVGNVYVSSNLTVDTETLHVDAEASHVGVNTKNPKANLHVVGNVYVSSNLTVDEDTLHVDVENDSVGVGTVNPKANLHVVGNVYVSSNLTVDTETLHVDSTMNSVGVGTKIPTSNLHVAGNAYVSSNTTTDGTLTLNHPMTALLTDLTSNVEIKLDQMANVVINTTDVDESLRSDHVLVYDGVNWVNEYPAHNYIRFYNDSGSTLYSGNCVYIVGHHNANLVEVGLASATSAATMPSIGIVYNTSVPQGEQGVAVAYGKVNQMDTSGFLEGDTLYVSNVNAGLLSNVKPYGVDLDLIQNIGVCTRSDKNSGTIFVTGIGRSNDIPNAQIVLDESDINYVYVNDQNNDLKKIIPSNLLTQLQTFEQVSAAGNTVSNIMTFTNTYTSIVTSSNINVGGNISVSDLTDPQKKYLTMVNQDGFFEKSPVYVDKDSGVYVIEAAEAEFQGNLTLSGNTTILNSESVTISDRIFGVAANNSATQLDSGFMIEHRDGDPLEYANVALIYHADEHRFSISYTQNTFTDNHIIHYDDPDHRMLIDLRANVEVQNNLTVKETLDVTGTGDIGGDFTVGGASNLFVDVSSSRVGINEASPTTSLDINGDARVQSVTDTTSKAAGALVVSGGLGVTSNIHSTNVYAASHVGVGTVTTTRPVHVVANSAGGIYVNGAGNDARVTLEATGTTADPVASFSVNGGAAFSMGIDNSINDTFNIANHTSDVGTNARMTMTPAGVTTITNTTNSTSKTTGALIVRGGLGVSEDIHGKNAFIEDVVSNSVAVLDTTNATSKTTGAVRISGGLGVSEDIHGKNVFIEDVVSNSVAVLDTTNATSKTTGAVRISGGLGVSEDIHGKNVFIEDVVSNSVAVLDTTNATSKITGAVTISGGLGVSEDIHGKNVFIEDVVSNSVAVLDTTNATSKITGAVTISGGLGVSEDIHGKNVFIEDVVSNSVVVLDTTVSDAKNTGALIVSGGVGVTGALYGSTADLDGVVTLTDTTEATSSTTGALKAAGGVGIAKDLYVGEQAYITGGLVTNMGGVTKKTYSFSNIVTSGGTAPEINVYFTSNVFYSKLTAQLVDDTDEVSTLVLEVAGGGRNGTVPTKNIKVGTKLIFGDATSTPWDSNVLVAPNRIMITPSGPLTNSGNCHVFMEYTSDVSSGGVSNVQFDYDQHVITFGY